MEMMAVLITADSVRDGIEQLILADLTEGLEANICLQEYLTIERGEVEKIYPRLLKKYFFPALLHNMTMGPSLFVVMEGEKLFQRIKDVKGKFRLIKGQLVRTGLRLKYQSRSIDQLMCEGYRGKQLFYRLFEFRMHATDNQEETFQLCKLLLAPSVFSSVLLKESNYNPL